MGDFNLEPNYLCMKSFLKSNRFKGAGSCIGSILTNKNYSFQYIRSYETGVTGHHHMIYTTLKNHVHEHRAKATEIPLL